MSGKSTEAVWLLLEIDAVTSKMFPSERGMYVNRRPKVAVTGFIIRAKGLGLHLRVWEAA